MIAEKLQQHLNRIEKETSRLVGKRRMTIHLAQKENKKNIKK